MFSHTRRREISIRTAHFSQESRNFVRTAQFSQEVKFHQNTSGFPRSLKSSRTGRKFPGATYRQNTYFSEHLLVAAFVLTWYGFIDRYSPEHYFIARQKSKFAATTEQQTPLASAVTLCYSKIHCSSEPHFQGSQHRQTLADSIFSSWNLFCWFHPTKMCFFLFTEKKIMIASTKIKLFLFCYSISLLILCIFNKVLLFEWDATNQFFFVLPKSHNKKENIPLVAIDVMSFFFVMLLSMLLYEKRRHFIGWKLRIKSCQPMKCLLLVFQRTF